MSQIVIFTLRTKGLKMDFKDTFFSIKQSLKLKDGLLDFKQSRIMGIINVSPDSFYAGSRKTEAGDILKKASEMILQGTDILDVGAYSSRPGAENISEKEEMLRLEKALGPIREFHPDVLISVDTFRAGIARRVVKDFAVDLINDISGGDLDKGMFPAIAELGVPYIIMHMKGNPSNMQDKAEYSDVVREIIRTFSEKISRLNLLGVKDIIIDPGFGFAKNIDHNFEILRQLEAFQIFSQPLMIGISRKSMIYKTLNISPSESLNGSSVLHTIALGKGANILRVHDVREAKEAILLVERTRMPGN